MKKKKIGIIDADLLDNGTRHPNLACMKISAYYKQNGWNVSLLENYESLDKYDLVSISRVFSFTNIPDCIYKNNKCKDPEHPELSLKKNIVIGGTGFYYEKAPDLPYEIEHIMPDYHLYDNYIQKKLDAGEPRSRYIDYLDFSIGFVTRGCFRKCSFCVNKKYDRVFKASPVSEFLDETRPKIYLWDDNIMASPNFIEIFNELIETGKPFQFRQGLDIRLMTEEKAKKISEAKYYGDYIFAFDHIEDKELISKKLELWRKFNLKSTKLYVLTGFDSQDEIDIKNTFERIKILMKYGCLPYIMRYEDYKLSKFKSMYIELARWCNQPSFIKKMSFRQYCIRNEEYHQGIQNRNKKGEYSNKLIIPNDITPKKKYCSCYQAMIDFEKDYPEIAKEYFDLRWEELNEYLNK